MKNSTKLIAILAAGLFLSACAKNPVVADNSRTNINDVRTTVISGDEIRKRYPGGFEAVGTYDHVY